MPGLLFPENYAARTRRLGLVILVVIGLVMVLAYLRPNPFAATREVRAVFDTIENVGVVPVEVRVAGVPVGRVSDKRRDGDDAIVTMQLNPAIRVYDDATARLRPRIAFEGTGFIELDPGSPGRDELGDAPIPENQTSDYVGLGEALRVARPETREALAADVEALAESLPGDAQSGVQRLLRDAPEIVKDLSEGARAAQGPSRSELAGTVAGFADTVEAVEREQRSLAPVLRGARTTLSSINVDEGGAIDRLLSELPARLDATSAGGRALRTIIDELDPLAVDLRPGVRDLGPLLERLGPVLVRARPALRDLGPSVEGLRSALASGARSTPATRRLVAELQPTAELLNDSLVPALRRPSRYGIPVYRQFFSLFQGGAGAFGAYQDDNSPDRRCKGPTLIDPTCERLGSGHFVRFGAVFDLARAPVLPCDPRATRCSAQQAEEERGTR